MSALNKNGRCLVFSTGLCKEKVGDKAHVYAIKHTDEAPIEAEVVSIETHTDDGRFVGGAFITLKKL